MRPSGMRVRVLSFGPLRAAIPAERAWRDAQPGQRVADLLQGLLEEGIFTGDALRSAAVAVNGEYARTDHVLSDGDEIAILPPVSGGSGARIELVTSVIETASIVERLKAPEDGAVCVFDGVVRNNTRGRSTLHLDYEAYEEMALRQMHKLRDDAVAKFGVREVAIVHRLGRLAVGETSVLIAVASAHRGAGFDACRWVIDTLKKTVPIWKKEQFTDGAVWADGESFPEDIGGAVP